MKQASIGQRANPINPGIPFLTQLVFYPTGYTDLAEAVADIANLNVVVCLPGQGEWNAATDGSGLSDLLVNELPKLLATSFNRTNDIFLCPQLWNDSVGWNGDRPKRIVDMLNTEYAGAKGYDITGISWGGMGVYDTLQVYPHFFNTAGILCGDWEQAQYLPTGATQGVVDITGTANIRHWHGTSDVTVLYSKGVTAINKYTTAGYLKEATLVSLSGQTHSIWGGVYDTNNLYFTWLDEKRSEYILPTHPTIFNSVEELEAMQNRWAVGSYTPIAYSTDMVALVQGRADYALANPDEDMMTTDIDVVPAADSEVTYSKHAATVYYMTGDEEYGNYAHDFVMTQIGLSIAEATQYSGATGENRVILTFSGAWYMRLLFMFLYCKPLFSPSEITECENWFDSWANLYKDIIHNRLITFIPDRLDRNYSTARYEASESGNTYTSYYTHEEPKDTLRNHITTFGQNYTNAYNNLVMGIGSWAAYSDDATLKLHSEIYIEEMLRYSTFPDGTDTEYRRNGDYGNPAQGANYYGIVGLETMVGVADLFFRKGDTHLYEFSTTAGLGGTEISEVNGIGKGSKSIRNRIECVIENYTQEVERHSVVPGTGGVTLMKNNPVGDVFGLPEVCLAIANRYYQEDRLYQTYMNTISGSIPYRAGAAFPIGEAGTPWTGAFGNYPIMPFQYYGFEYLVPNQPILFGGKFSRKLIYGM